MIRFGSDARRRCHRCATALALAAGWAVACAAPGRAQQAPVPDTAVALDSVFVDALRIPTPLRAAPFAVSVVTGNDAHVARAGRGFAEILHGVPGVQAADRSNDALGERIVIRGFGARAGFGVRGVKVLVDGVPATMPDGQTSLNHVELGTLGSAEVERGPASALYGNAAGGVLRVSSRTAPPVALAPRVEAMIGSHGLWRRHGGVAGSVGDYWYDASMTRRDLAGFREHADSEKTFLRLAGGMPAGPGELRVQAIGVDYSADNPGSLAADALAADRTAAHPFNVTQRAGESARQLLAGATWVAPIRPGTLELTGYGGARSLDNPIPVTIIDLDRTTAGLRAVLATGAGDPLGHDRRGIAFAAGAELDLQRDDRRNFANDAGERGPLELDQLERVLALGSFLHVRVPFADRREASAGQRYDRFRFRVEDRLTAGADPDDSGRRDMDALSPSLALHARIGPALDLFASASTAFETPTTTELANRPDGAGGFNPALEPQRTLSVEAGARGGTGPLDYEAAAYRALVDDALVPFEVPDSPGRQFYRNAGSATHQGVELALRLRGPLRLHWDAAYTWTDARFDDFTVDGTSHAGNRVPGIAPHRLDLGVTWLAARGLVALELSHSAVVPVDDANSAEAADWTVVDARAEWRLPVDGAGLRLFAGVRNLLDDEYVGSVVVNAFGGRYYEPAPGRSLHAGIRAELD